MYGLPCKSYLQMLYPKHNQGIGLSLGVFRTPVESFYLDAHKPSLGVRRANYLCSKLPKIKSLQKHPTYNAVFNKYMRLFDAGQIQSVLLAFASSNF